jgi:hypothetical protein
MRTRLRSASQSRARWTCCRTEDPNLMKPDEICCSCWAKLLQVGHSRYLRMFHDGSWFMSSGLANAGSSSPPGGVRDTDPIWTDYINYINHNRSLFYGFDMLFMSFHSEHLINPCFMFLIYQAFRAFLEFSSPLRWQLCCLADETSVECVNSVQSIELSASLGSVIQLIRMWDASQRESMSSALEFLWSLQHAHTVKQKYAAVQCICLCFLFWYMCTSEIFGMPLLFALEGAEQALRTPNWCVRSLEMELVKLCGTAMSCLMNCWINCSMNCYELWNVLLCLVSTSQRSFWHQFPHLIPTSVQFPLYIVVHLIHSDSFWFTSGLLALLALAVYLCCHLMDGNARQFKDFGGTLRRIPGSVAESQWRKTAFSGSVAGCTFQIQCTVHTEI